MPNLDPRIDAYIEKSGDFAKPILRHLREVVHEGCPEVEETMKWSFPHFDYKGMMCSMAAFKEHCTFGFWKPGPILGDAAREGGMGQFGRITSVKDLPARKVLIGYVKEARELNDAGVKPKRAPRPKKAKPELPVPEELTAAFAQKKHAKARAAWEGFAPSHRREYLEWIAEAKREETRARRVAQTLEWLAEGKQRNWKYT